MSHSASSRPSLSAKHLSTKLSPRKQAIAEHFAQAQNYSHHAKVQQQVCHELVTRLCGDEVEQVLEIGAGGGTLTQLLTQHLSAGVWHINDLCASHAQTLQTLVPDATLYLGDGEHLLATWSHLPQPPCYDLIISANAVQWFDEPLQFVSHASHCLKTGGQLLFNTFTPAHFIELKTLTGQGLHYPEVSAWEQALQLAGLEVRELTVLSYPQYFASPLAVLKHIRATGVSTRNRERPFIWTKSSLARFVEAYQAQFSDEAGQVRLSYEVLVVDAVKP